MSLRNQFLRDTKKQSIHPKSRTFSPFYGQKVYPFAQVGVFFIGRLFVTLVAINLRELIDSRRLNTKKEFYMVTSTTHTKKSPIQILVFFVLAFLFQENCNREKNSVVEFVKEYSDKTDSIKFAEIQPLLREKLKYLNYVLLHAASDSQHYYITKHVTNSDTNKIKFDTSVTFSIIVNLLINDIDTADCTLRMNNNGFINMFHIHGTPYSHEYWNYKSNTIEDAQQKRQLDSIGRYYAEVLGFETYDRDIITGKSDGYLLSYVYLSKKEHKKYLVYDPYINMYLGKDMKLQSIHFGR